MITELRSILKVHVYRVFLWVFLGVLIFGGMSFDFSDNRPWVVKAYQQKSTEIDYHQALSNSQRQYDYLKAQGITWPRTESIEKEVLRHVVTNLLMKNVADQLDLGVPSRLLQEQLEGQLANLPEYFFDQKGQLNVAMLEKLIAPKTFESFLEGMEDELESNLLFNIVSIGSYVSQFEIAAQLTEEYANKKYSILKFSLDKALEKVKEKVVSDETLERFYKKTEHGDLYKTVEKRSGVYWKFNSKDYGLAISKSEVSAYYDQHKQEYLETPAQVQVHRIFFEQHDNYDAKAQAQTVHDEVMENPTTFAATAKKLAGSKLSYQGAEKTDYFAKDSSKYDKVLVETAFEQLAEDHAISSVIKTDKGYEILQRIGRKSAKHKSLEDVRHEIEEKILEEKFAKRFKQDAERLVANARYNKEALPAFVDKKHGHKEVMNLDERKTNLFAIQLFQTEAGQYAIFMDGKSGVLLECQEVQKRALKPFSSVKSKVRDDFYHKQAEEELQAMAAAAMKQAATKSFEAISKEYSAHFETAEAEYKDDQMDQSAILRKPNIAQKIKTLQSAGAMIVVVTPAESYVIRLDEVASVSESLVKEKIATVQAILASKAKYKGRDSFIASLYRHAKLNNKIEVKEQLLKDIKDAAL
ncbi:peptidyl-prolyl cis-trans isomerase [Candidatus Babeliales bacterium]|nr:peptidyl-prolyl cis-trans isomerase [Candidatus Babeliales bacterium]MBP9843933.1 peptidyl-prolyl cis-trans isomerase [Candidatus Babeliales bacterium]